MQMEISADDEAMLLSLGYYNTVSVNEAGEVVMNGSIVIDTPENAAKYGL